uniref:Succinyl-CoA:3-ketoacid-coenzyme A transferase n=1 Tax=Romanomermis culicivorax TaxID=13658 RepID=A0A915K4U6_ROMCU
TSRLADRKTKFFDSTAQAVDDVRDGSSILLGGFGICGIPENLIDALVRKNSQNLTVVTNNSGQPDWGVGRLIRTKQIKRLIAAYIGDNREVEEQYLSGQLEVEITPQGTIAERLRAAGAGISAFYTRTGVGTLIQHGGLPLKYGQNGKIELFTEPKEMRNFGGEDYIMERALQADFALIKAWKADTAGNLIFRKTARNFNPLMCKAAKISVAEVEDVVPAGQLDPDNVHVPGIFVDRIVKGHKYEKRVAKLVTKHSSNNGAIKETENRLKIAKRAAQEFKDGIYVNLGVGIPSLCLRFIPENVQFQIQSENGILGLGPYPEEGEVDPDLINAGKETATVLPGASFFSSDDSFAMIRGGHIDVTILGALQVSQYGDLANWLVPDKSIKGMGGAMDLVSAPGSRVVITMEHTVKGQPKILPQCTLPLTGRNVVNVVITEMAVFETDKHLGLTVKELANGVTMDDLRRHTPCDFNVF